MSGSRDNTWRAIAGTAGLGALIGGVIYGAVQLYEYYEENERNNAERNAFADRRGLPGNGTQNRCPICRNDLVLKVITLDCRHKFHKDCFMAAIMSQCMKPGQNKHTCPIASCRRIVSPRTMEQFSTDGGSRRSSISSNNNIPLKTSEQFSPEERTPLALTSCNSFIPPTVGEQFSPETKTRVSSTSSNSEIPPITSEQLSPKTKTRVSSTSSDSDIPPITSEHLSPETKTRVSSTSSDTDIPPITSEQCSPEAKSRLSSTSSDIDIPLATMKQLSTHERITYPSTSTSGMLSSTSSNNCIPPTTIGNFSQNSLNKSVDVVGIKYQEGEDLILIFNTISEKIGFNIEGELFDTYYRHRRKGVFSDIITYKFLKQAHKLYFLESCRENRNILNTYKIDIYKGPVKSRHNIFVNEAMSDYNRQLFNLCRCSQKYGFFKYFWFRNGSIYIRRNDNEQRVRIQNENDLNNILDGWLPREPNHKSGSSPESKLQNTNVESLDRGGGNYDGGLDSGKLVKGKRIKGKANSAPPEDRKRSGQGSFRPSRNFRPSKSTN